jgi:hypothetical protein
MTRTLAKKLLFSGVAALGIIGATSPAAFAYSGNSNYSSSNNNYSNNNCRMDMNNYGWQGNDWYRDNNDMCQMPYRSNMNNNYNNNYMASYQQNNGCDHNSY